MKYLLILLLFILALVVCFQSESEVEVVPVDLLVSADKLKKISPEKEVTLVIRNSDDKAIQQSMDHNQISKILLAKKGDQISITFYLKVWFSWLKPLHYFHYSSNGYTEEQQVDSIEQSIATNTHDFYHFCQPLNMDKWFYCEKQD